MTGLATHNKECFIIINLPVLYTTPLWSRAPRLRAHVARRTRRRRLRVAVRATVTLEGFPTASPANRRYRKSDWKLKIILAGHYKRKPSILIFTLIPSTCQRKADFLDKKCLETARIRWKFFMCRQEKQQCVFNVIDCTTRMLKRREEEVIELPATFQNGLRKAFWWRLPVS